MRVLAVLFMFLLAGCVEEATCPPDCASRSEVPVHDVEVQAVAINDCPPNSTCAPIGGGAGESEVLVDGNVTGITDQWGRLTLQGIPEGQHAVCARHPYYGSSGPTEFWSTEGADPIRLLVRKHGPPCVPPTS